MLEVRESTWVITRHVDIWFDILIKIGIFDGICIKEIANILHVISIWKHFSFIAFVGASYVHPLNRRGIKLIKGSVGKLFFQSLCRPNIRSLEAKALAGLLNSFEKVGTLVESHDVRHKLADYKRSWLIVILENPTEILLEHLDELFSVFDLKVYFYRPNRLAEY